MIISQNPLPAETPPSAANTTDKLVDAAAHLFARHGIEAVPLRDIGAHAGQRNASAVQYHFGGRWELVAGILSRHEATVAGWDPGEAGSLEAVVRGLVSLLRPELDDESGRDFLRVIAELMTRYPGRWDDDPRANAGMHALVQQVIALSKPLAPAVARARAVAMTQFVTHQMAERARLLDDGERGLLDAEVFSENLVLMSLAMLTAPAPTDPTPTTRRNRRAP